MSQQAKTEVRTIEPTPRGLAESHFFDRPSASNLRALRAVFTPTQGSNIAPFRGSGRIDFSSGKPEAFDLELFVIAALTSQVISNQIAVGDTRRIPVPHIVITGVLNNGQRLTGLCDPVDDAANVVRQYLGGLNEEGRKDVTGAIKLWAQAEENGQRLITPEQNPLLHRLAAEL